MECVEFEDEVLRITVSIGHSLKSADFVVDAFEGAAGDGEVVPVENSGDIFSKPHRSTQQKIPEPTANEGGATS
jgi:hypothetical protein